MRKITTALIAISGLMLAGCQQTYYYSDTSNDESTIKAYSDSAAYKEAFLKFRIAKKVYTDLSKKYGGDNFQKPTSFTLKNKEGMDISSTITFQSKQQFEDSVTKAIAGRQNILGADSSEVMRVGVFAKRDTIGIHLAPVKVTSARFVKEEYSSYRDVRLGYKNISNKTVTAIRFRWYGENSFAEPADMGGMIAGMGNGFTEDILKPGRSESGTWSVLSRDGKKIIIAFPYEVMFSDGTKWKLKD